MQDLIAKLEAAKEGGWELDFAIQQKVEGWKNLGGGWREWTATGKREQYNYGIPSPPYTTSLDAALTLVDVGNISYCSIHRNVSAETWVVDLHYPAPGAIAKAESKSIALSLTIAALKARSASHE